jgi:hypothetical protein
MPRIMAFCICSTSSLWNEHRSYSISFKTTRTVASTSRHVTEPSATLSAQNRGLDRTSSRNEEAICKAARTMSSGFQLYVMLLPRVNRVLRRGECFCIAETVAGCSLASRDAISAFRHDRTNWADRESRMQAANARVWKDNRVRVRYSASWPGDSVNREASAGMSLQRWIAGAIIEVSLICLALACLRRSTYLGLRDRHL